MSVARTLTRLTLIIAAAIGAAMMSASTAVAANADFTLTVKVFPTNTVVINRSYEYEIRVANHSATAYPAVQRVVVVQLPGLTPDGITVGKNAGSPLNKTSGGSGRVVFTDPKLIRVTATGQSGNAMTWAYVFKLTATAPPGQAKFTFLALDGGTLINSAASTTTVLNPGYVKPSPTRKPTSAPSAGHSPTSPPTAIPSATASTAAATPAASSAATDAPSADETVSEADQPTVDSETPGANGGTSDSTMPPIVYVAGAGLLGGGVAVLWFVRRRSPGHDDDDYPYDDSPPRGPHPRGPHLGGPRPTGSDNDQTAEMPVLRQSHGRTHIIGG